MEIHLRLKFQDPIKDFINYDEIKIISFEKIDVNSLLITDIFDGNLNNKIIQKTLSKKQILILIQNNRFSVWVPNEYVNFDGALLSPLLC